MKRKSVRLDWWTSRLHPSCSSRNAGERDFIISKQAISQTYLGSVLYSSSIALH